MAGAISPLPSMPRLEPLGGASFPAPVVGGTGFAGVLNGVIEGNTQADLAANAALADLASGKAQDLHTVSLAVAKADLSFRFILELRNRLTEAFQEVTRMQI